MRAIVEFFVFLVIGLLLLEPILELAGVSHDRARNGAFSASERMRSADFNEMNQIHAQLTKFLRSAENPEVLIIGSSLVLWPAVACDGLGTPSEPRIKTGFNCRLYSKCNYLKTLLESKLRKSIDGVTNVSVPATYMEDHALIFTTAVSQKKRPKLLIVGIHPSQFFKAKPFLADWASLNLRLAAIGRENQRSFSWEILRDRILMSVLANRLERERLAAAAEGTKLERQKARFKLLYQPYDSVSMRRNLLKLEEMARVAKILDIPLLLVDMPARSDHIALIDKSRLAEYKQRVAEISTLYGASYFDTNTESKYAVEDFADFSHLNRQGGEKLYATLSEIIGRDYHLNRLLCGQKNSTR